MKKIAVIFLITCLLFLSANCGRNIQIKPSCCILSDSSFKVKGCVQGYGDELPHLNCTSSFFDTGYADLAQTVNKDCSTIPQCQEFIGNCAGYDENYGAYNFPNNEHLCSSNKEASYVCENGIFILGEECITKCDEKTGFCKED